jgi:hypothetical protein
MTAPYFVIVSGRLNVTATGASKLRTLTGRPSNTWYASGMRPGSPLRAKLEQDVAALQAKCSFPGVTATNHHIYPGSRITTILSGALQQNANSLDLVNNYINSRKGIYNQLLSFVNRGDES